MLFPTEQTSNFACSDEPSHRISYEHTIAVVHSAFHEGKSMPLLPPDPAVFLVEDDPLIHQRTLLYAC